MIQRLCLALLAGGASARQLRGGGAFPKALDIFIASFSCKLVFDGLDLALFNADPAARLAATSQTQSKKCSSRATPLRATSSTSWRLCKEDACFRRRTT